MSDTAAFAPDWPSYYHAVKMGSPRHTLVRALASIAARDRTGEPPVAVDLGCGGGRDTLLLLERGWQVHAIDAEAAAIDYLHARLGPQSALAQRLETQVCSFDNVKWPQSAQLVNASFSLPFCPPDRFPRLWRTIEGALRDGGWFCGQFFGDRDEWSPYDNITSQSRDALDTLLKNFAIVELNEEEYDGETATNQPKHWHLFHVVAHRSEPGAA
ncbi:MAG: methyltransferase domain-containing protein [Geitlerinemataceae cyanobacterium]